MKKNKEEADLTEHAELNESISPNQNDISVSMALNTSGVSYNHSINH